MSRIGNKAVEIPAGVEVTIDGSKVTVKGPKGTLEREFNSNVVIEKEENQVKVSIKDMQYHNLQGLTRTLINNMVLGVQNEFERKLQINGVGYRVQKQGNNILMSLGYSHQVPFEAPQGITFDCPDANTIIVKGIDKELVGQVAADIRMKRPPEVYGGKGVKYEEEHIRRKVGKAGKK